MVIYDNDDTVLSTSAGTMNMIVKSIAIKMSKTTRPRTTTTKTVRSTVIRTTTVTAELKSTTAAARAMIADTMTTTTAKASKTTTTNRTLGNYSSCWQPYFDPWRVPQHVCDHDMQHVSQCDHDNYCERVHVRAMMMMSMEWRNDDYIGRRGRRIALESGKAEMLSAS
jgi:hypothetical protein